MSKPQTLKGEVRAKIRSWTIAAMCWTTATGTGTAAAIVASPPLATLLLALLAGYMAFSALYAGWQAYRGYRLLHHPLFYIAAIQHDLSRPQDS